LKDEHARLDGLEKRWADEKAIVDGVLDLRAKLREGALPVDTPAAADPASAAEQAPAAPSMAPEEREKLLGELRTLESKLVELQGERPLILPAVDEQA